jgi:hypothetical protein
MRPGAARNLPLSLSIPLEKEEIMETTQIEAKAQEFIDALHALETGTTDAIGPLVALYAENAKLNNSALDNKDQAAEGHDQITQFWTQYKETLGEVKSNFHQITVNGEAAGLFWTTEGTNPAGDNVHYHGSTLLEFDESGLIAHFRGYYDTRELTVKATA